MAQKIKLGKGSFHMANKATKQYNGMILLTGYLQRLFVAETIYRRLNEPHDPERFEKAKSLLDEAYTIVQVFEKTQSLTYEQKEQLLLIVKKTENLMASYFKEETTYSFPQKIAIVGSSLYAEQHVNSGIVRLGEIFKVEVNRDFHMRIKFYEQRTKVIDYLVYSIENKEQPVEQIMKAIDSWFNDVMRNKEFILNDLNQIPQMLEHEK